MKRAILSISIFLLIMIHLCAQNEFSGVVKFDKTIYDFGDFKISDGEKRCTFTFTNISNKPIVVHRVISSCGCTEPVWTKSPVRPGEKGTIDITFKNDQGPYPFDKAITTYISDVDKPIILRVKGIVHEKKMSLEELFEIKIGSFAIREEVINLGQIDQGLSRNESVEVANISNYPISVEFTELSEGLKLSLSENPIPSKSKALLTIVIDTKKTGDKLWGKNIFSSSVSANGKLQKGKIQVATLIKENFSDYSEQQRKSGALPQFETSSQSMGTCKKGSVKELSFSYKNIGKEALVFYKVESSEAGCTFEFPQVIDPGKEGVLKVSVDTSDAEGEILYILTVITNAPVRPILNLFITGNIE